MSKQCYSCMRQTENMDFCEHCGYDLSTQNQPHQLPQGTVLKDQYLVGRVLGQGGFGITYMGWDQNLQIPVAIKEYYPMGVVQRHTQMGSQVYCVSGEAPALFEKHKAKFLREARTLAQLADIPGIVQVRNFFPENGTAYMVMEYVQGVTLKDWLKRLGRPLTEAEALQIMEPALQALAQVHDHHLIHRDLSPDNIMLPDSGGIKLIDFGAVRYTDDNGLSKSTEAVLKAGFAPLEQYSTRGKLGTWTDVYAMCATFHYMLTGRVPVPAMERVENGENLELLRAREDISRTTVAALEAGMKLRFTERLQTVEDLCRSLYQQETEIPEAPEVMPEELPAVPNKSRKMKRHPILAACAAGIALLLAAMMLLPKNRPEQTPPAEQTAPQLQTMPATAAPETAPPVTVPPETQRQETDPREIRYEEAAALEARGQTAKAAIAFGKLGDYQDARARSFALWSDIQEYNTLAAGIWCTVGVRNDGTVLAAGSNEKGQCDVSGWRNVISVSAAMESTFALCADGTVLAAGDNSLGQCEVSQWQDIVQISENGRNIVGLRADGTVVATGDNTFGQCEVSGWTDIVCVVASPYFQLDRNVLNCVTVGLKSDGTVVAAGGGGESWVNDVSQWRDIIAVTAGGYHIAGLKADGTVVSVGTEKQLWTLPLSRMDVDGWQNIICIDADPRQTVGLCSDGTVVAVGDNNHYRNLEVSDWRSVTAISAGYAVTAGLFTDGTVRAIGWNRYGCCEVDDWRNIVAVRVGDCHTVGLKEDGTVVAVGWNESGQCEVSHWRDIRLPKAP